MGEAPLEPSYLKPSTPLVLSTMMSIQQKTDLVSLGAAGQPGCPAWKCSMLQALPG